LNGLSVDYQATIDPVDSANRSGTQHSGFSRCFPAPSKCWRN
jgi:hypothetical protein